MVKATKTAFELEAMILAEMLQSGECPIGVGVKVTAHEGSWQTETESDDPSCAGRIEKIADKLRAKYDLE